ncbi:DENN domain-containing protein 3 isoform X1 [Tachysurus vachellii]|uniref:DENN domain-containing protein 3 isoform X1 n=1 Tax=Tachysurus vachellii TaxID=175792 RepID=UPI00296B0E94|nr:DENN domain-containing protein 3 isoform X1 [Tachysurus vachellii]XP_060752879.1 DENN domain-containing protein 3 isoform X1 [Tachysurus vachellii]
MANNIPLGLLEACVVVGASSDRLKEFCLSQLQGAKDKDALLLDAEVLQVHAPPFVTKENTSNSLGHASAFSRVQRRRSFLKKKKERAAVSSSNGTKTETDDQSVPKDIDLIALPQLCFPGGLRVVSESQEDSYHFLVFTDVFGNQTHGVVVQYYKPIQVSVENIAYKNGHYLAKPPKLFTAYGICLISKHPYYNALRDCLSSFLVQLKNCRMAEFEEHVKEFSAKLALVPIPPPGQLQVAFNLKPLQIILPPREDMDRPAVDLDLHLPFLCLPPEQILQVICSILTEQRVVFFSSDWARLTLVAECFMLFIHPLHWQHPFVPVLSQQMLDFLMAPTAYIMGCHLQHLEDVAAEMDDLILIDIDDGTVTSSCAADLPDMPLAARECFKKRVKGLQLHYDLELCRHGSSMDVTDMRTRRRKWQRKLNSEILNISLELIVNIFREVHDHLNFEHRVFNSEEFFRAQEPGDQPFYKKVSDTHIFHSFLKDCLNRKIGAFAQMKINTQSEAFRLRTMTESPQRPNMNEVTRKQPDYQLRKRLGMSLPNLVEDFSLMAPMRHLSFQKSDKGSTLKPVFKIPPKPVKTFKLPEFPPPLAYQYVQNYYSELISQLSKAINSVTPEESSLLARYYYLRGLVNSVVGKRVDALTDFQNLHRTDMDIFPLELVTTLTDSLRTEERNAAEGRPELKRLISRVKKSSSMDDNPDGGSVKKFELPRTHMFLDDFVRRVQESGIVKDLGTIQRLFHALTVGMESTAKVSAQSVFYLDSSSDGQQKQVDPEVFRFFYTIWKETEAEAQDVDLPVAVLDHLEANEQVYKLSSSVKTSHGVGKIAMTQRRLFLLTEGHPGYVEVTKFRDIEEVKISSAPLLFLRIPSLKIKTSLRRETFEANLKSECDLWHLMIKELWAGRKIADEHKDPQYIQQALTNALLMDAVVRCLQSQKAIYAASKLAYFDTMKREVPMMVPKTTSETLKHKINPCLDLTSPQAVDVLLYTPGQLGTAASGGSGYPKLWCALSDGKVVVFDAASWSLQQNCIQMGTSRLNCMLGVDQQQLWIGSQDSIIYIINPNSMSCNKQLTEHRAEITGLAMEERPDKYSQLLAYSCSAEGTVIIWDVATLQPRRDIRLTCDRLQSIQFHSGRLWCCARDCVMEVRRNGTVHRRISLPDHLRGSPSSYSSFIIFNERTQLWTGCTDSGELCVWHLADPEKTFSRITLPDCTSVMCMIRVKNQIWVGGHSKSGGKARGKIYVVDTERLLVEKELLAHSDTVQTLCSAEDRYVLSGAAGQDGKIAIWKVE